jgi:RNA polymerase sigma factor (sigma-70 family)
MYSADGYLVDKCLNGEPEAFSLLVDKYRMGVYALAYSKLHNFHDAEDLAQEVFIKAYKKLHTLRRYDNFHAWLYAITTNLCKDQIRNQKSRIDNEFIEDQDSEVLDSNSMDAYRDDQVVSLIHEALDSLPEIYRQALTLHYLGGMNTREIAEFVGSSTGAIKERLSRARSKMKEELITMISDTFSQKKLQSIFTFNIVEIVKNLKLPSTPQIPLISWGISLTTGSIFLMFAFLGSFLSFSPHISQYSYSNGGVMALGSEMPAVFTNFIGLGASGISNNDGSSQNPAKEETTQETKASSEKSESNNRIENLPAKFTNRNELVNSREPGEDCYGVSFYTIYVSIPIGDDVKQLPKESPWNTLMDIHNPDKNFSPLIISKLILKEYPQAEIKILYNEGLNLKKRVNREQAFLPSVVAYIDEHGKRQYKTFLVDEYDRKVQIDSVCADNINEIWNSSWRRLPPIPDKTYFPISAKFRDDLNKKIMSKELWEELRRELAGYGVQLSPTAEITDDETEWRIDQDDFWFAIQKQDKDYLNFVIRLKGNPKGNWKSRGGYSASFIEYTPPLNFITGHDLPSVFMPSIPKLSNTVIIGASWDDKSSGSLDFGRVTTTHYDHITLYPGEVLDITKPPLISIDSKYAIKPPEKEKTEK